MSSELAIYEGIVRDMAEGVLTIGFDGKITSINNACRKILEVGDEIIGKSFAATFFEREENDAFNQSVLNAVYDSSTSQNSVVDYVAESGTKKLFITTSYLKSGEVNNGVIAVLNDVSELFELKDAVKAMEKIKKLNDQLSLRNQLISETFGRYLSDEIVKTLLDTPDGRSLGGKKQKVTIIMSDIRGFTAMSEIMEPVDLMSMLNNYLAAMTDIIQRYKGTIIEFIGDAIFAIFGAPLECDDHAANAVKCAIEMQNAMKAVNEFNEAKEYPLLQMGIGINTGEVILGNIGSEKRAKYGVVGQNVNLAGRIEGYTVGGQIWISEYTSSEIKALKTRGEAEILPKGVPIPVKIYDVSAVGEVKLDVSDEEYEQLETPEEINFHVIDGKYAKAETVTAHITARSKNRAVLDTEMKIFTNIKFIHDGREVFAKFIAKNIIHITF